MPTLFECAGLCVTFEFKGAGAGNLVSAKVGSQLMVIKGG